MISLSKFDGGPKETFFSTVTTSLLHR